MKFLQLVFTAYFFTILNFSLFAQAPAFEWVVHPQGVFSESGDGIANDVFGNVYVIGEFRDTVDFDPGTAIFNLNGEGLYNTYVAKYNTDGQFVWAKSFTGLQHTNGGIATDLEENVYLTGRFTDTADFDPGLGTYNLSADGSTDIYIVKLDVNGSFVWAKSIGGDKRDGGLSIAVDENGNVFTTGCFKGEVDFDPGPNYYELDAGTSLDDDNNEVFYSDIFISKLDSNGDFVWAKSAGGTSGECGSSITLDDEGNVYVSGDYNHGSGSTDIYVSKQNNDGAFLWQKQIGGVLDAGNGKSIKVDIDGNAYITGYFDGTLDFDSGPDTHLMTSNGEDDIFILKLDSEGDYIWAKSIGASSQDEGRGIALDNNKNIYITGNFDEVVDFDPGPEAYPLSNLSDDGEIFLLKLDTDGSFLWAGALEGDGGSQWESRGRAISLDQWDNIYTTGSFTETTDFAPDASVYELTANGQYGAFIHKMSQACNTLSIPGTPCDDGNASTIDDVIQSDGCTCVGEIPGGPCNIMYTISGSSISITGADAAHVKIRVFTDLWEPVFSCFDDCDSPQLVTGLTSGTYKLKILLMDSDWQTFCDFDEDFTIASGPCTDEDNDGYCLVDDCDDNNPNLPEVPGTTCDDNDANTINDVIQPDACTCAGEMPGNSCNITYTISGSSITINGADAAHVKIRVVTNTWEPIFSCFDDCDSPQLVTGLTPGDYRLVILLMDNDWQTICDFDEAFTITTAFAGPCEVDYTISGNSISFTIVPSPHYKVRLFDPSWEEIFSCIDDCDSPQIIDNLALGHYRLQVQLFDESWTTSCNEHVDLVIDSNAIINEEDAEEDINGAVHLYPNPSEGYIYVSSERGLGRSAEFEVYNALGQMVQSQFVKELFLNPVKLDLEGQLNGYYTLVIKLEDGRRVVRRFVLVAKY